MAVSTIADRPSSGGGFNWGSLFNTIIPLAGSLVASKMTKSPQEQTAATNAATLANLPPELKEWLKIQTDNAKLAQPLYQNVMAAQNRLLPAWARQNAVGGSASMAPVSGGGSGAGSATGTTVPTFTPSTGVQPGSDYGNLPKSPEIGGSTGGYFGGKAADGTGDSGLDPQMVLSILGMLSGMGPMTSAVGQAIKANKPKTPSVSFDLR